MQALRLEDYHHLVVLTGAGVSVASGIRPFRGPGGLWEERPEAERLATAEQWAADPAVVWRVFGPMRGLLESAQPNAAHQALARLEQRCRDQHREFLLVTQNVDGLHQRAGSHDVAELHGSLRHTRCSDPLCSLPRYPDAGEYPQGAPPCPRCGAALRPDIVLFGEELAFEAEMRAKRALRDCDLFLAVGTSGTVAPASRFVRSARYVGARTVLVNLEAVGEGEFDEVYLGPAEDLLPGYV